MKKRRALAQAPRWLFDWLAQPRQGSVLLVTSRGCYLTLDGQIILLCSAVWGITPIGISLPEMMWQETAKMQPGQMVSWREGVLRFPDVELWLEVTAAELPPVTAKPEPGPLGRGEALLSGPMPGKGLASLCAPLLLGQEPETLTPWAGAALPLLRELMQSLRQGKKDGAAEAACALLGLGNGLTPSGDDVLCGMLYVLERSPAARWESVRCLKDMLHREGARRTNAISAAYLAAIAAGAEYERMRDVLIWLSGEGEDRVHRLLEVGSSSGSDMLLGMLLACRLLEDV